MRVRSLLAALALVVAIPSAAHAFCGFYVAPGEGPLLADATQVVLMRKGTRTVLSMQNNYKGPPSDFAMVIPVPVVLKESDVKTLGKDVFARVEQMGAPRLVEYWEQDPCPQPEEESAEDQIKSEMAPRKKMAARPSAAAADLGVTVEATFAVGEYKIVILSAKDSTGLDTYLRQEKYNIPAGAEALLRPYVEGGMKFFVAKVDVAKVRFAADGRADLSPLRFHYDTDQFVLPIRLGLANSSGTQDLIVNILAPSQRYEVANYPNVTIPTNLDVKDSVRDNFGAFYATLFDRTLARAPGSVVTEYAWQATTCDPCPGPALNGRDFMLLGADVLDGNQAQLAADATGPPPPGRSMKRRMPPRWGGDFVLTRLHARYGKDLKDDLVFKAAPPIVGGREFVVDPATHRLEEGARPSPINNFQGRYAIRHPWTGAIACANPRRGIWGGPTGGGRPPIRPALGLAFAPRGGIQLAAAIVPQDVPELGLAGGVLEPLAASSSAGGEPSSHGGPGHVPAPPKPRRGTRGCGCDSGQATGHSAIVFALVLLLVLPRSRLPRRRRKP